jgi:hypothetical protein
MGTLVNPKLRKKAKKDNMRPTGVELLHLKLKFKEVQQEAWLNAVNSKWTMQRLTTHKMTTARSHENDKQTNLEDGSLD